MNRKKLLIENFLVYGLGSVISKIIPFVMLPVITFLLPNETYFGVNDLYNTVTSLCCTVGIFGMTDTAFRFFFDKNDEDYKKSVCTTTGLISAFSTIISVIVLLLFRQIISVNIYGSEDYSFLIYFNVFAVLLGNASSFLSLPTRMQNKRKVFLIVNSTTSLVTYLIAMLFIINGWYLSALPLAAIVSSGLSLIVFFLLNRKWFSISKYKKELVKPLLKFGLPQMPIHLMYYVINTSDKWMIAFFLGQSMNGLYAVGSKFGQVSQLIHSAFAGGWVYYRYATKDATDQVDNISKIFEMLGYISFSAFVVCCIFSKWVVKFVFRDIYAESFITIPYLFFSPLVQMLFQITAGQFSIIKKTWVNLLFLLSGVICNISFNYFFIPKIGIEGAAIATFFGYLVTLLLSAVVCVKTGMLRVRKKFLLSAVITIVFFIIWRIDTDNFIVYLPVGLIVLLIMAVFYKEEIRVLIGRKTSKKK